MKTERLDCERMECDELEIEFKYVNEFLSDGMSWTAELTNWMRLEKEVGCRSGNHG